MTAVINGFDTRADIGLRRPRSVSHNIAPERGGVGVHWFGPGLDIRHHSECRARWRQAQDMHMAPGGLGTTNGAADIAYNLGVCIHRIVLAGRGLNVRSGANGTSDANGRFYAVCAIVGSGDRVTSGLLDALDWCILRARVAGDAGDDVEPHSRWRKTSCPGNQLRGHAAERDGKPIPRRPDDGGHWTDQWPEWIRPTAREWARRGIITRHTKPDKALARMTLWELHTFAGRLGAPDATSSGTDLDQRVGDTSYAELLAFLDRWGA